MMVLIEGTTNGDAILNINDLMIEIYMDEDIDKFNINYRLNTSKGETTIYFQFTDKKTRDTEFNKIKELLMNKKEEL